MTRTLPDLTLVDDVIAAVVLDAARVASARLRQLGVRHALVGGIAVGAHGYPRATKDVDFLVSDDAFEHHAGGVVTLRAGVPIQVNGVLVDLLSVLPQDGALVAVPVTPRDDELPVAPIGALVHLKLKSPRMKDATDVVELLKAGADRVECRAWLDANAPALRAQFEVLVSRADAEAE